MYHAVLSSPLEVWRCGRCGNCALGTRVLYVFYGYHAVLSFPLEVGRCGRCGGLCVGDAHAVCVQHVPCGAQLFARGVGCGRISTGMVPPLADWGRGVLVDEGGSEALMDDRAENAGPSRQGRVGGPDGWQGEWDLAEEGGF
eukprot:352245-Chlamydomonas_euryale.AAC.3